MFPTYVKCFCMRDVISEFESEIEGSHASCALMLFLCSILCLMCGVWCLQCVYLLVVECQRKQPQCSVMFRCLYKM